jgi:hypothetical protein
METVSAAKMTGDGGRGPNGSLETWKQFVTPCFCVFSCFQGILETTGNKAGNGNSQRSGVSEAASLQRCATSRQKPAHRFAESGHKSGYIFEVDFNFENIPSILGFFAFQYDSCNKSRTEKMRV